MHCNTELIHGQTTIVINISQRPANNDSMSSTCIEPRHWLKAPEHVQYKLATIVYHSLNGMVPDYLAADLRCLSDMPSRQRLQSSLTHQLNVRQSQCATVGDQTFAVASARLWDSLSPDIIVCDTLPRFRREIKTFLFRQSYPSILV